MRFADGTLINNPSFSSAGATGCSHTARARPTPNSVTPRPQPGPTLATSTPAGRTRQASCNTRPSAVLAQSYPVATAPIQSARIQAMPSFTLNSIGPQMSLRQLVHPSADLSCFKTFKIHESLTFEIRGEFSMSSTLPTSEAPEQSRFLKLGLRNPDSGQRPAPHSTHRTNQLLTRHSNPRCEVYDGLAARFHSAAT